MQGYQTWRLRKQSYLRQQNCLLSKIYCQLMGFRNKKFPKKGRRLHTKKKSWLKELLTSLCKVIHSMSHFSCERRIGKKFFSWKRAYFMAHVCVDGTFYVAIHHITRYNVLLSLWRSFLPKERKKKFFPKKFFFIPLLNSSETYEKVLYNNTHSQQKKRGSHDTFCVASSSHTHTHTLLLYSSEWAMCSII